MSRKPRILVADDDRRNRHLLEAVLVPEGYAVVCAEDGQETLDLVGEEPPDLILLDVMMPRLDGFETVQRLKRNPDTRTIPVVMVTALQSVEDRVRSIDAGADDFLSKPIDLTELRARVASLLKVKAYNDYMRNHQAELEREVAKHTEKLREAFEKARLASLDTITRLATAAEYKDEDTGAHIQRMSQYSAAVARRMGQDERTVERILYAAPMHDVGKIGIPDRVLLKPGKLDAEEWAIMQTHTVIGARILRDGDDFVGMGETIALTHHEKWDGSGYPNGLRGEDIPLVGRIVAVADVFDALTSRRPYKEPFSVEKSLGIIREGRGRHFQPEVLDAFEEVLEEVLDVMARCRDDDVSHLYRLNGHATPQPRA